MSRSSSPFFSAMHDMREAFHRWGRINDANAKLDEVARLFAAYVAFRRGEIAAFPTPQARQIVARLHESFAAITHLDVFRTRNGRSIFGEKAELDLEDGDEELARELVRVVRLAVDAALGDGGEPFDSLNETFGSFIRDNFRSHVEDAQYMTPPEVVAFMADVAADVLEAEGHSGPLKVMDPSCGVGSFLSAFHQRLPRLSRCPPSAVQLIGQDKVERMVRLTAINMALFSVGSHEVTIGNSLAKGSSLDRHNGTVDIILTNPPFGARFDHSEIKTGFGTNVPFFDAMTASNARIDSELLFLDRCLTLLRPGGWLFIVVPDGVVSAKGLPALLRRDLETRSQLRAVIDLPPVTFAQAGTRTRTSILVLRKAQPSRARPAAPPVVMATVEQIGFVVSSRKGLKIKSVSGCDMLPSVRTAIAGFATRTMPADTEILDREPSITLVPKSAIPSGNWSPGHYSARRIAAIQSLADKPDFEIVPLSEIALAVADTRRAARPTPGTPYISVLHVIGEGLVDLRAILRYAPKTPGIPVRSGEVLFSRLNPHITRVCVAPDLAADMLCSSEFEILQPRGGFSSYALAFLMQSRSFIRQVCELTSGTSSSHNRIRSEQLMTILLAVPKTGTAARHRLDEYIEKYRATMEALTLGSLELAMLRNGEDEVLDSITSAKTSRSNAATAHAEPTQNRHEPAGDRDIARITGSPRKRSGTIQQDFGSLGGKSWS